MNDFSTAVSALNNREIATLIWLTTLLTILSVKKPEVLKVGKGVVSAFMNWKLLTMFGSFAAYIAASCWLIASFGLWQADQLLPTIGWAVFSGAVTLARSIQAEDDRQYFEKLFVQNFKLAAAFEFVVVAYSFPFLAEMVLVPVLTVTTLLLAVGEGKAEYRVLINLLQSILAVFVLVCLYWSVSQIWDSPSDFFTSNTGRNFILPFVLFLLSFPFFYIWYCVTRVENAWIRLGFKQFQSDDLKRYARRRFTLLFGLRPWLLRKAVNEFQTLPAQTESDVEQIIDDIIAKNVHVVNPPRVPVEAGWSPHFATAVLADWDLATGEYHRDSYGDGWYAGSKIIELDDELLPNTIAFYIEGSEHVVTNLKLKGHFLHEFSPGRAVAAFTEFAKALVDCAMDGTPDAIASYVDGQHDFSISTQRTRISRETEPFPNGRGFNISFKLERSAGENGQTKTKI